MSSGAPLELLRPTIPYTPDLYLNGLYALPPWLSYKKQRFYSYSFSSTINTPNQQQSLINMDGDSFFLLEAINLIAVNESGQNQVPVNVSFSDTSKGINWSPSNVTFSDIGGLGANTRYIGFPTFFKPGSTIYYQLTNDVAAGVPVYGSFIGRKIFGLTFDEAAFLARRVWYQYAVSIGPLAPATSNSYPIQTANDSDFYFWRISCAAGIAYSKASGQLLVNVRDITTDKNILANPCEIQTIAGEQYAQNASNLNGSLYGRVFSFGTPRLIKRNATVIVDIQNLNPSGASFGAVTSPVELTLEGVRVFD